MVFLKSRRKWLKWSLTLGLYGLPVGIGYNCFNYFVILWLKKMGVTNALVTLTKLLALPLLLRTAPLSFFGVRAISLHKSMAVCVLALLICFWAGVGRVVPLISGAFLGCVGVCMFEAWYGSVCATYTIAHVKRRMLGVFFIGYRSGGVFAKGLCIYIAGVWGWHGSFLLILFVFVLLWWVMHRIGHKPQVEATSVFDAWKRIWNKHSSNQLFVLLFCLLPDAFFEAMIIPFWMDHHVSLKDLAIAKGGFAMLGALMGSLIALRFHSNSPEKMFRKVIPINFIFHLLPILYIFYPINNLIHVISFFAHVGHAMLSSAYYVYIMGTVENSRQYEIFLSFSYAVTFLSAASGFFWDLLGQSWILFFIFVSAANWVTLSTILFCRNVSRETIQ